MLFDNFPTTLFQLSPTNRIVVTDFIRVVKIDTSLKENDLAFIIYEAQNGETPEIISHKFYKSTEYHWVIMLLNEKFDPWRDFPQSDAIVIKNANEQYANVNDIHHYEDSNGNVVDSTYPLATPITNLEYERKMNEDKRTIKVLRPEILPEFINQYKKLVSI